MHLSQKHRQVMEVLYSFKRFIKDIFHEKGFLVTEL